MPPPPARTSPPLTPHPQYLDNVINNGTAQYANAYFELNYIRAFAVNSSMVVNADGSPASSGVGSPSATSSSSGSAASTGAPVVNLCARNRMN